MSWLKEIIVQLEQTAQRLAQLEERVQAFNGELLEAPEKEEACYWLYDNKDTECPWRGWHSKAGRGYWVRSRQAQNDVSPMTWVQARRDYVSLIRDFSFLGGRLLIVREGENV